MLLVWRGQKKQCPPQLSLGGRTRTEDGLLLLFWGVDRQVIAEDVFALSACCLLAGDPGVPSRHRPLVGWTGLRSRSPGHPLLLRRCAPPFISYLRYAIQYDTQVIHSSGDSFPVIVVKRRACMCILSIYDLSVCVSTSCSSPPCLCLDWICSWSFSTWFVWPLSLCEWFICIYVYKYIYQDSRQVDVSGLQVKNKSCTADMCCTT